MIFKSLYIYPQIDYETDLHLLFQWVESFPGIQYDWFFIRYVDAEGEHIRFRLNANQAEAAFPVLKTYFMKTKEVEYEPETARYGGVRNLFLCETAFNFSSRLLAHCYQEFESFPYENRLVFALAVNRLIYTRNLSSEACIKANEVFYTMWMHHAMQLLHETNEAAMEAHYKKGFEKFRDELPGQLQQIEEYLLEQFPADAFHVPLTGVTEQQRSDVINSLVHMSNNRFGIANIDEAFLAFILARISI